MPPNSSAIATSCSCEGRRRIAAADGARRTPSEGAAAPEAPQAADRDADVAVVRAATDAQRQRLVALRADGTIGDAAFQRVQEALDWAELDWAQVVR